jgi:hypothetical protein
MDYTFWEIAFVIFVIFLAIKLYHHFFIPKLEQKLYLKVISEHHFRSSVLIKLDLQKRIKRKLEIEEHGYFLSQIKDKGLVEDRFIRTKKGNYDLPMKQYRLTKKCIFTRDGLLK